jgi:hypothetical protein
VWDVTVFTKNRDAYQERDFVEGLRARGIVPHVAECPGAYRRVSHWLANERADEGFEVSQRARKMVEKVFGWGKRARPVKQMKLRGVRRVDWPFRFVMATHNLLRLEKVNSGAVSVGPWCVRATSKTLRYLRGGTLAVPPTRKIAQESTDVSIMGEFFRKL